MIKFFHYIAAVWWCFWSNIRWKKAERFLDIVLDEDKNLTTINSIQKMLNRVFEKFHWTEDSIDQLWDSIQPPPQNYQHYLNGNLNDDCDGWSSLINYILHYNGYRVYLLSVMEAFGGHCVSLFKFKNKWYIIDYKTIQQGFDTIQEALDDYNIIYKKRYNIKGEVKSNYIIKYDYIKGKFKLLNKKRIQN